MSQIQKVIRIAEMCHATNREWCRLNGDNSQKAWNDAEQWQRDSAVAGVEFKLANPNLGPDAQHNAWMKDKLDQGWKYGEVKDDVKKTHPCLVPYDQLPEFQKQKDKLFVAIVNALK